LVYAETSYAKVQCVVLFPDYVKPAGSLRSNNI
jgi:hypothetical protein